MAQKKLAPGMLIRLSVPQDRRIREESERRGMAVSELIRRAIDAYAPAENGKEEGR